MLTNPHFLTFLGNLHSLFETMNENGRTYFTGIEVDAGSSYIKLTKICGGGRTAYCFVAVKDFATKTMGTVKAGEIFMAASYKAPAKHERGNIWEPEGFFSRATPYGVGYLR